MDEEVGGFEEAKGYILGAVPGVVHSLMEEIYPPEGGGDSRKEDKRRAMRDALKGLFERYRESEPGGAVRAVADMMLRVNIKCAPPGDDLYRKRHNAVVLRYITEKPMADKEICKRLNIRAEKLESWIDKAMEDMMPGFYGVDFWEVMP